MVRDNLWLMKKKLKKLKAVKERLEASGLGQQSGHGGPLSSCRVSGLVLAKGGVAELNTPNKKGKHKPKRHPVLPLDERQEYYKSYLAQFKYWPCFGATDCSHQVCNVKLHSKH